MSEITNAYPSLCGLRLLRLNVIRSRRRLPQLQKLRRLMNTLGPWCVGMLLNSWADLAPSQIASMWWKGLVISRWFCGSTLMMALPRASALAPHDL